MATHKHQNTRIISLPSEQVPEAPKTVGVQALACLSQPKGCTPTRRGVILLVLLGMLALFAATAFAFVVVASHAKRSAKSLQKVDRVSFSPRLDLEETLRQVLRGPNGQDYRSVLRHHSLLEDLNGDATAQGWIISSRVFQPAAGTPWWIDPKGLPLEYTPDQKYYPPNLTPPSPPPFQHASSLAAGQIVEFIAGYTVPSGAATGGTTGAGLFNAPTTRTYPYLPTIWGDEGEGFPRHVGKTLTIRDPSSFLFNQTTRIVGYRRVEIDDGGTPPTLQVVYHIYQVLPFEGFSADRTRDYFLTANHSGFDFLINGAPFSGTGAGYNPGTSRNDAEYSSNRPYCLLPNPTDPNYHTNVAYSANEDYDAPDYQNMLLAMEHYDDGTAMTLTRSPSLQRPALANYWIHRLVDELVADSFNRIDAWHAVIQPYGYDGIRNNIDDASLPVPLARRDEIVAIKRHCLMRPLQEDHNHFNGSNPRWPSIGQTVLSVGDPSNPTDPVALAALERLARRSWGAANLAPGQTFPWDGMGGEVVPWDVDNDGDGIPDSIWVDIGLPRRSLPDGRLYRPLVAIHCVDLDGRINLNTAGSVEQLYAKYGDNFSPGDPSDAGVPHGYLDDGTAYAQSLVDGNLPTTAPNLLRGQGAGPAEISPLPVLGNATLYQNLLLGNVSMQLDGRYGELRRRAAAPAGELRWPSPAFTPLDFNYYTNPPQPESLMRSRLFGYPANYFSAVANGTALAYGSPLDLKGTMALGLDLFGQPIYSAVGGIQFNAGNVHQNLAWGWNTQTWAATGFDTPYELKLGTTAAQSVGTYADVDNPFTVGELEPLLRRYDTDIVRLPDRLRRLVAAGPASLYRLRATTESWDIPVPGMALPDELLQALGSAPIHPTDVVGAKLLELQLNHTALKNELNLQAGSAWFYPNPENVDLSTLLSTDIRSGLRMDLNRLFGNGQDDNANRVVDEPNEPGDAATNYRLVYARTLYVLAMALVDPNWYPYWDHPELGDDPANEASYRKKREVRARALAQWAVNVVDYRDPDSIMTRFDYDPYPFEIDGATLSFSPTVNDPDDSRLDGKLINTWNPDGTRFVWGCERPELLITETLAAHDRRQLQTDPGPPAEYSTPFRPEGALFVELFNPNTPEEPAPGEFAVDRSVGSNVGGIRLNQTTSVGNDPVWRLALYDVPRGGGGAGLMPNGSGYTDPLDPVIGANPIRLVYFVNDSVPDSGVLPEAATVGVAFFPSANINVAPILPHRYGVVGPGDTANRAYGPASAPGVLAGTTLLGELPTNAAQARRIEIVPNTNPNQAGQVRIFADGQNDQVEQLRAAGSIQPPVGILIDQPHRLSVSEPDTGYAADTDASYDWSNGYGVGTEILAEDLARTDDISKTTLDVNGNPISWDGPLSQAGTTTAVRYVHVQRLANPLLAYSATTNPYITVDTAPVDLTVFDSASVAANHALVSSQTREYPQGGATLQDALFTRQRGEEQTTLADSTAQFWRPLLLKDPQNATTSLPESRDPAELPIPLAVAGHQYFNGPFNHSLGFLNEFYYYRQSGDTRIIPADFSVDNDYRGAPGRVYDNGGTLNFESHPFPWLPWLNRPFANPLELLQVPAVSPTRLLFAYQNNDFTQNLNLPYVSGQQNFAHLAPFFAALGADPAFPIPEDDAINSVGKFYPYDYDGDDTTDDTIPDIRSPHLYRLLEYVHVPSRFIDAQTEGNLAKMALPGETHFFPPPYHFIPAYREPGKININTMAELPVLKGLFNDHMPASDVQTWEEFLATRRGYPLPSAGDYFGLENPASGPPLPTRIANPFRTFTGASLVTSVPGRDAGGTNPPYLTANVVQQGVNAGLLRARVNNWPTSTQADFDETLNTRTPMFPDANQSTAEYDNVVKNPFLKYQSLQRFSNLVTNRSNVYAVWITIGYFEVEPVPGFNPGNPLNQQLYPDGYTLGQEIGSSEGDVVRHRAFYIIDRSIPVAYIPGEDLNTDKTILLRRYIE